MTTSPPLVIRTVDADTAKSAIRRYGADHFADLGLGDHIATRWPIDGVRQLAARVAGTADPDLPDRPAKVAAALTALCDQAEAGPVDDWDRLNVTGDDYDLFTDWRRRMDTRSPLLHDVVRELDELTSYSAVVHARRVLAVLADVDLLLPGADAALREAPERYAAVTR